jgi:hypothetical protein
MVKLQYKILWLILHMHLRVGLLCTRALYVQINVSNRYIEYSLKRHQILVNMCYLYICNMALINFDICIVGIYAALQSWKNPLFAPNDVCVCLLMSAHADKV